VEFFFAWSKKNTLTQNFLFFSMVRKYHPNKDTKREENLQNAVAAVNNGSSVRVAARTFNVKKSTVHLRLKNLKNKPTYTKYETKRIFSDTQEEMLEEYMLEAAKIHYGMTYVRARILAYEFAEINNIEMPPSWSSRKTAGVDWIRAFMTRHKNLSLRKPENTSMARASAFNKANVGVFFSNLTEAVTKYGFEAKDIINIDETGLATVVEPPRVIAARGARQVGQISSAERGELVTFVGIITAAGTTIPPAFVFPRVNFKIQFLAGGPSASLGLAYKTGWMTTENFLKVLTHIQTFTRCSVEKPILLILDNHSSHTSILCINFCRSNGIVILTLPPHCSHKLQPLDCGIYGPFKAKIKVVMNNMLLTRPGEKNHKHE
jgi:transposase